ncbi:MAG: response regulator [Deltaproteobacteria bacterium]|nr:response regulator [Deltaproteobacteria bacterium]MBN2671744.1 response regulator [Deltaproteobacteria bacterium]
MRKIRTPFNQAAQSSEARYPSPTVSPMTDSADFSVLLVDDSFVSLRGMARVLKNHWETDVASDAEEALYMIKRNRYTVVISDCDMPGKDGIWLLEQTAQVAPQTIRILTSCGERDRFSEHITSGLVQCFLKKPVSPEQLSELLAHFVI